jgi:hypothetical protein
MYEVKIGFDHKEKRYEIGDIIKREGFSNKTWKELKTMGVIEKADLNQNLKRARNDKGHFIADDPNTPENEAWYEEEKEEE